VETHVEELPDNHVRLTVDVAPEDLKHAVEHAASDLAASAKIPGFRKGKVPLPVLISRVGKERLYAEAVESHIGGWFLNAATRSRIRPVEQPRFDYELPGSDEERFQFTADVAVQPKPDVPDWSGLEVPRPEAEVPEDLVEHELGVLQGAVAELAPVEDRPAQLGDTVIVDLEADGGDSHRDYVVELGSGRLVEELEEGLVGVSAGETKTIEFELADESQRTVTATVKEIKEKLLPPLDDDFARTASEFDTLEELRGEIESRLRAQLEAEIDAGFRAATADRLVEAAKVEASGPLVESRTRTLLNELVQSLQRRGIAAETYLQLTNQTPEQLTERLRAEARQSVARELVLEAVADRLGIEVSNAEAEAEVREQAEAAGEDAEPVLEELRHSGQLDLLREDLRLRTALDQVASEVKPIPVELAAARESIWTPDKEKPETETKLWTPASKES